MSDVIFDIDSTRNRSITYQTNENNMENIKANMMKIVKGVGMYEVISKTGLVITIGLCYRYKPTMMFTNSKIGNQFLEYSKNKFPKCTSMINKGSEKFSLFFSTNKYLKKIPETLGLKAKRFGKAVTESFFIYHMMVPIYGTIAFKLSLLKNK